MKLTHAILILFISIVIQTSFVMTFSLFSFAPNLFLVAIFLLCYFSSFEKVLILSIIAGIFAGFFDSIGFGVSLAAIFISCELSYYLRKNILKGGRFNDFLLNSLATFLTFYCLLGIAGVYFELPADYIKIFNLININLAGEIFLNIIFSVLGYRIAEYYSRNKIYGFIQNIKISP